jgi:hypothetical protein
MNTYVISSEKEPTRAGLPTGSSFSMKESSESAGSSTGSSFSMTSIAARVKEIVMQYGLTIRDGLVRWVAGTRSCELSCRKKQSKRERSVANLQVNVGSGENGEVTILYSAGTNRLR